MVRKRPIAAMPVDILSLPSSKGRLMRTLLLLVGLVAILLGALWIGQGTGVVMWPASSFMLQQTQWAYYGAALVIIGLLMLVYSARRGG
jgi:type IV secretory pathway TrbD component